MGYTTDFEGEFKINKPVDNETAKLLRGLTTTRRMKREGLPEKYGIEGEFFCEDTEDCGQTDNPSQGKIVDYNEPPRTQPGLWCQWKLQEDNQTIKWDGNEKFYGYIEWLKYIIDKILAPKGYIVNGEVEWNGEEQGDTGKVIVVNNKVKTRPLVTVGVISWPDSQACVGCKHSSLVNDIEKYGSSAYICEFGIAPDGKGEDMCSEHIHIPVEE